MKTAEAPMDRIGEARPSARRPASRKVEVGPKGRDRRGDLAWAALWMIAALAARAPLAARIEGLLDHDQAIVGLMALDIAEGRRLPIFFDGQRYMGAVEAYVAAGLVAVLGHAPAVIALAPTLAFGLFVAGQFLLWTRWAGRPTGHLAAAIAAVGSPMLALWGVAPRGGYSELLAWAVPVLGTYRASTRPGGSGGPRSPMGQAGWGFLLAFGYFLNPLSLVVYATLGLDWAIGRHGLDVRRERGLDGGPFDSRWAPALGLAGGTLILLILGVGVHVVIDPETSRAHYIALLGLVSDRLAAPVGALVVIGTLGGIAWWLGVPRRLLGMLSGGAWAGLGGLLALGPFLLYDLRVRFAGAPRDASLPIWIRAPWAIGPNLRHGLGALAPLIGCDPHAATFSLVGHSVEIPPPAWPGPTRMISIVLVMVAAALIASVVWRDHRAWADFWAFRGDRPTRPTVLMTIGLATCIGLYLLQVTSADGTSIRYLLPAWIVLPGLLARGLLIWPRPARLAAGALLLIPWSIAQVQIGADMAAPCSLRPVVDELDRRAIRGVVGPASVVQVVADLSAGRIGGLEYHAFWPRLRDRYAGRFAECRPIVCVNDLRLGRPPIEDIGLRLRDLSGREPGRVRLVWRRDRYEIWEADVPMAAILDPAPCPPGRDRGT